MVLQRKKADPEFSTEILSTSEKLIISILYNSENALNAFEIYTKILVLRASDFEEASDKIISRNREIDKEYPKDIMTVARERLKKITDAYTQDRRKIADYFWEKKYEDAAKIMRSHGHDVPTYPRIKRILEGLEKEGFVSKRKTESGKGAEVWFLEKAIRKLIGQEVGIGLFQTVPNVKRSDFSL